MLEEMVTSEEFFLRYAVPCGNVLVQIGTISQERYDSLKEGLKLKKFPPRESIENSFPEAFKRIKRLASRMNKEYWDIEVMREYWEVEHNEVIDRKEGNYAFFPETFREFCKTHVAKVVEELSGENVLVEYEGTTIPVTKEYVPDVKLGDRVRIHHAYIAFKV